MRNIIIVAGVAWIISTAVSMAVNITWAGTGGDGSNWVDRLNWSPDTEYPGETTSNNTALINNGDTVISTGTVPQRVGFSLLGGSTLNITGGSMSLANQQNLVGGANGGSLNLSGGAVTLNGGQVRVQGNGGTTGLSGTGVLHVTGGSLLSVSNITSTYVLYSSNTGVTNRGLSEVHLSGTATWGNDRLTGYFSDLAYNDSRFTITGSGVTTGGRDIFVRPKYSTGSSTLAFVADSGGVSPFSATFQIYLAGPAQDDPGITNAADLSVDVTALPGEQTVTLVNYGSLLNGTFGTIEVVNGGSPLAPGTWDALTAGEYALDYGDGSADSIRLQYNTATGPVTDTDFDGLPDDWEVANFGSITNANATTDLDDDGFPDISEYVAGTMPTNGLSRLDTLIDPASAGTDLVISWPSVSGRVYGIDRSTNGLEQWDVWQTNLSATVPLNTFTNSGPEAGNANFRINVNLP